MTHSTRFLAPVSTIIIILTAVLPALPLRAEESNPDPDSRAASLAWQDSPAITHLFEEAGVDGTFVLYDVAKQRLTGHNRERAETRFVPASTFKIPNSLIGLATGAIENVDEVLPYGGQSQPIEAWERDMSLRDAIPISNVPVYQELARRIGLEPMRENVAKLGYGNAKTGAVVDRFWLDGPLKISAIEQVRFLASLAQRKLPFPEDAQASVREIIQLEQGPGWSLFGKTGWANAPDTGIGWWVGWVEKDGGVYAFAVNIDIKDPADAPKRIELGKSSLRILGIL